MHLFSPRSIQLCTDRSLKYIKGSLKTRYKHNEALFSFQDNIPFSSNNKVVLPVPLIVFCPIVQFY